MKKKEPNAMLVRGWFSEKHNQSDLGFRKDKGKNSACGMRETDNKSSEVHRYDNHIRQSKQLRTEEFLKDITDEENWSSEVDMGFWGGQDTEEVIPKYYEDQDGQFENNRQQTEVFHNKYQSRLLDKENNNKNEYYFENKKKTLKSSRSQDTLIQKKRNQSLLANDKNQFTEKDFDNNELMYAETKSKDRGNKENKRNSSKSPVKSYHQTMKTNNSKSPLKNFSKNISSNEAIITTAVMTNQNKRVQSRQNRSPLKSLWNSNNIMQIQQDNSYEQSNDKEEEYDIEATKITEPTGFTAQPTKREIELEKIIKKQKEQYHLMLLKFRDQVHQLKIEQKAQQQEKIQEYEASQQREIDLMKKERELKEFQRKLVEQQKKQDIKDIELSERQSEIVKAEQQIKLQQKELEEFMDSLKIKEANLLALQRNQGGNIEGFQGNNGNDYNAHNGMGYEFEEISFCERSNRGIIDSQVSQQLQKYPNQQQQEQTFPLVGRNQLQFDGQRDILKNPFETAKEIKMLNSNIITESVDLKQEYNQEGQLEQKKVERQLFFDSLQTSEQQVRLKESEVYDDLSYSQQQEYPISKIIKTGNQILKDEFVVATFDFEAQQVGDMSIQCGDRIQVLKKNKNGWWMGALNGKTGYFPSNFTQP